jgi:hypothetical protein
MVAKPLKLLVRHRVLCVPFASVALTMLLALALVAIGGTAEAACTGVVAQDGPRLWRAAAGEQKAVAIDFLGHASFLIGGQHPSFLNNLRLDRPIVLHFVLRHVGAV